MKSPTEAAMSTPRFRGDAVALKRDRKAFRRDSGQPMPTKPAGCRVGLGGPLQDMALLQPPPPRRRPASAAPPRRPAGRRPGTWGTHSSLTRIQQSSGTSATASAALQTLLPGGSGEAVRQLNVILGAAFALGREVPAQVLYPLGCCRSAHREDRDRVGGGGPGFSSVSLRVLTRPKQLQVRQVKALRA